MTTGNEPNHVGRPRTIGGVKIAVTLGREHLAYLRTVDGNRSAAIRRVIEEHQQAGAPKPIDRVQALGEQVCMLVPQARQFVITPAFYNDKVFDLKWVVTLDSGATHDFGVIVTDDGKDRSGVDDDTIVQTLQRSIAQWEYEELLRR